MGDIKPEIADGKTMPLKEKTFSNFEAIEERIGRGVDMEKIKKIEQARKTVVDEITHTENQVPAAATAAVSPAAGIMAPTAKRQKQVESILAEDLAEIYLSLAPQKRQEFKIKGEQTANKISQLLTKAKINIGEIIKLIKKWLMLIPGVNKYFLEQEAKIKADEIVKLK